MDVGFYDQTAVEGSASWTVDEGLAADCEVASGSCWQPWWAQDPCQQAPQRKQLLQQAGRASLDVQMRPRKHYLNLLVVSCPDYAARWPEVAWQL